MCQLLANRYRVKSPRWSSEATAPFEAGDIRDLHRSLPEYVPTPLVSLPALAERLGVGQILIKDESFRFGLEAFKALGASYAVYRFVRRHLETLGKRPPVAGEFYSHSPILKPNQFTFCTATDGNHGRAVAWVARKLGQRARIFMPRDTVAARIENIRGEGAEVTVVDGSYDQAVRTAAREAVANGWEMISDTAWEGYEDTPRWIQAGYRTLFGEIDEQLDSVTPDFVFVPAGVGALAAAAAWHYSCGEDRSVARLIAVEPQGAACCLASIGSPDGQPHPLGEETRSIMAGLNCGTPSPVAWPLIRQRFDWFVSIPDKYAIKAMCALAAPSDDDPRVVSGESGAAGLAALLALTGSEAGRLRERIGLGPESAVLLLNTEGATDPDSFAKITTGGL